MKKLDVFCNRMEKLGIELKMWTNLPWIYLGEINGKTVTEKFQSDHHFTLGFLPIRIGQEFTFTDLTEIFKLIRKYK